MINIKYGPGYHANTIIKVMRADLGDCPGRGIDLTRVKRMDKENNV